MHDDRRDAASMVPQQLLVRLCVCVCARARVGVCEGVCEGVFARARTY